MAHKIFTFDKLQVFFKHTDYYGFVHPYNYLEWSSYAREAFFQELVPSFHSLCNGAIKMVTTAVRFRLLREAVFGDRIVVKIYSKNVKKISFDVIFNFYNLKDNQILGCGEQKLTFVDSSKFRPCLIPVDLKKIVLEYERKDGLNQ